MRWVNKLPCKVIERDIEFVLLQIIGNVYNNTFESFSFEISGLASNILLMLFTARIRAKKSVLGDYHVLRTHFVMRLVKFLERPKIAFRCVKNKKKMYWRKV